MKKQVLVSVDRGETRVALLEATGSPAPNATVAPPPHSKARRPATASPSSTSSAAARARSSATSTRAGSTTSCPAWRPPSSTSASRRTASCTSTRSCCPGVETPQRGRGRGGGGPAITDLLKPGQEIVVQVVKDPLKTKGARLSMELAIAGRYMVYAPHGRGRRRLAPARRQGARPPAQGGRQGSTCAAAARSSAPPPTAPSARTSSASCSTSSSSTRCSRSASRRPRRPAMVFQEADLSVRVVRDIFSEHFERAIVDDPKQHHRLVSFFTAHRARARRPRRAVGGGRAAVRDATASRR